MKTEDFLSLLEQRKLLPPQIVEKIRNKIQRGNHRLTSEALLKYLVQRKLIGRRTAKQLLETELQVDAHAKSSILGHMASKESESQELSPPVPDLEFERSSDRESTEPGPMLGFTIGTERHCEGKLGTKKHIHSGQME